MPGATRPRRLSSFQRAAGAVVSDARISPGVKSGLRHLHVFLGGVVLVHVAHVSAEQDLATGSTKVHQLRERRGHQTLHYFAGT